MSKKNKNKNIGQKVDISEVSGDLNLSGEINSTQVKSGNLVDKSNETKIINNYFNSEEFYKDSVQKYDSVDRLGIYNRVGEIVTCEVILLAQTRFVKGKEYNVVANVIEDGKLIADHLHVDFGDYCPCSSRLQITGEVYAYGPDNDRRGIKIIEEPYTLQDTFKIFDKPYNYIDITEKDYEQINAWLNDMDNKTICNLIEKLKNILNNLSMSRLGKDTIFNYAMTQITLNSNNTLIYTNKIYRFKKPILVFAVLLLSSIIYELTTLIDDEKYIFEISEDRKFAEMNILNIFKNIAIKCNCLQGLNGTLGTTTANEVFKWYCKNLNVPSNKAYAHTVKHRYTNFELTEEDEINIMDDKSFYAVVVRYM